MGKKGRLGKAMIRILAFFSCGCNQYKSFHELITLQSNKKIFVKTKVLQICKMSEHFLQIAFLFLQRQHCKIILHSKRE